MNEGRVMLVETTPTRIEMFDPQRRFSLRKQVDPNQSKVNAPSQHTTYTTATGVHPRNRNTVLTKYLALIIAITSKGTRRLGQNTELDSALLASSLGKLSAMP